VCPFFTNASNIFHDENVKKGHYEDKLADAQYEEKGIGAIHLIGTARNERLVVQGSFFLFIEYTAKKNRH